MVLPALAAILIDPHPWAGASAVPALAGDDVEEPGPQEEPEDEPVV